MAIIYKRYSGISSLPSSYSDVTIIDYQLDFTQVYGPSVVNFKYFIPLAEQSKSIFGGLPSPDTYSYPDGVPDNRSMSLRKRGLDLSEKQEKLGEMIENIKDLNTSIQNDSELYDNIQSAKKKDKE